MNRIKISPLAYSGTCESEAQAKFSKTLRKDLGANNRHRNQDSSVFVPMHYEKNYRYPLVVWLHSDTETSDEISQVMPKVSMRNYVAVAPSCSNGNRWQQDIDSIEAAHTSVINSIDMAMSRYSVNPGRIFLGGFAGGGTMALRIAMERPELFAGVMSINGAMPESNAPLGCWEECRNLPVFLTQARQSDSFDQITLCRQLRLLHVAGFALTLRQYPGVESLSGKLLQDLNRWIMEVVNTPAIDTPNSAK
jgi:phospholipase/carboxylesterase